MLDNDDVSFFALLMTSSAGIWVFLVLLFVLIAVAVTVSQNEDDCAKRECVTGEPVLLEGECRCVGRSLPASTRLRPAPPYATH